jgi:hypothetical protein
MTKDPIVEEVHRIREKMLADCDGDFAKLFERLRDAQKQDEERVVKKDQLPGSKATQ